MLTTSKPGSDVLSLPKVHPIELFGSTLAYLSTVGMGLNNTAELTTTLERQANSESKRRIRKENRPIEGE